MYVMHVFSGAEETLDRKVWHWQAFIGGYCTHVKSIGSNILFR
jgi:hypothetical protein